jgi:hypothetical protein
MCNSASSRKPKVTTYIAVLPGGPEIRLMIDLQLALPLPIVEP